MESLLLKVTKKSHWDKCLQRIPRLSYYGNMTGKIGHLDYPIINNPIQYMDIS